jgi:SAM-dependent methyltransferase
MEEDTAVRATSFGAIAEDYDRYRPGPPPAAADWLLPGGASLVADVCAGTGGLTRILDGRVQTVVAVELDRRMLAVLAGRVPEAAAVCANGEILPFRPASLDAVLISSAWHWLDPAIAAAEIGRVLRPGGVLGVVWSGPDRSVAWIADLLGPSRWTSPAPPVPPVSGRSRRSLVLPATAPFHDPERQLIEWSLPRTRQELVGLAGTYSRVITQGPAERLEIARRAAQVIDGDPAFAGTDAVEVPMASVCWRAVRR